MASISKVLIANRGEVATRIARAVAGLGLRSVGIHSADDADSLHLRHCDEVVSLDGTGPSAYLDADQIVTRALEIGASHIHPGYGFLSENADFARACENHGIVFIGPDAGVLEEFGDKSKARALALAHGVPILPGTPHAATKEQMREFLDGLGPAFTEGKVAALIKAVAGGGGRGMRIVRRRGELDAAYDLCAAEAQGAFGSPDVYIEQLLESAQHIEVQLIGDGTGAISHIWDRDCSIQRRNQKLVEIAPSRIADDELRQRILYAAKRLAGALNYRGLATVEFLVSEDGDFYFMETNPRLQVEHTVTEEVTGLDLVRAQIQVCSGHTLQDLGLEQQQIPAPRGYAVQVRINAEVMKPDGTTVPQSGRISAFHLASGRGIRADANAYAGYSINPRFDSLLAKLIVHSNLTDFESVAAIADRALAESQISGVETNIDLQRAILRSDEFRDGTARTNFVDTNIKALLDAVPEAQALFAYHAAVPQAARAAVALPEGVSGVESPMSGAVVSIEVAPGDTVKAGQTLLILESMKMQHVIAAPEAGEVQEIHTSTGDVVDANAIVVSYQPRASADGDVTEQQQIDPDYIRPDLAGLIDRKKFLWDENRPRAVEKRHKLGKRTVRENVDRLIDPGTFVEYNSLVIAAQRKRRSLDDLIENTPADGLVTGLARVGEATFGREKSMCAVFAYDYTVLAGTQGYWNHKKTDRIFDVAYRQKHPVILFCEGGGGRPGDVDPDKVSGLSNPSWLWLGKLSGTVPLVGITSGRCFAGNAAMLGVCDVVIATSDSNIGMGGPAMIEGGGLGVFAPEEIGPIDVQTRNGVVDIEVPDEDEAVDVAKKYLSYFQGDVPDFQAHDQRLLRHVIPENRKRVYDVRQAIELLFDVDSVLELRAKFGTTIITALARLEGRAVGVIANNPKVLGGALDSDGSDKAARFIQLCDVFGIPIVSLCDTPGFMVGPDSEKTASVRHMSRMFLRGGNAAIPIAMVVLRKCYGLGGMAMGGASTFVPMIGLAWPTSEFGGMGLEGAVRLGFRKELEAIEDPDDREKRYQELVDGMYEWGGGINTATHLEIDDVIDPADTRRLLALSIGDVDKGKWTNNHSNPLIDSW